MVGYIKRAMDVIASAAGLVLFFPLMVAIGAIVRLRMGSPILFTQQRPGLHGKAFTYLKFRTMTEEKDEHGILLPDSHRLTALGRFLRKTSLDEIPSLLSVLKGDMSLVGPRPLLMEYMPLYSSVQARRHEVKPGLTGLAVVEGRNALSWDRRFALDVQYVENWSLLLDLKILVRTIGLVLRRDGVSAEGHATMYPYRGSKDSDA